MRSARKPKKRQVWRTLLLIAVSLILGVNLYRWNAGGLVGDRLPMPFGYGVSVVLSGSMEPTLQVNDLVLLKKSDDIAVGTVVVYQSGQELIIHRVIAVDGDTVITQGDANDVADAPVSRADIKGVMLGSIPYVGWIVRMLRKPAVVLVVLIAAFLLMELSFRKTMRDDSDERERIKEEIYRLSEEQSKP